MGEREERGGVEMMEPIGWVACCTQRGSLWLVLGWVTIPSAFHRAHVMTRRCTEGGGVGRREVAEGGCQGRGGIRGLGGRRSVGRVSDCPVGSSCVCQKSHSQPSCFFVTCSGSVAAVFSGVTCVLCV